MTFITYNPDEVSLLPSGGGVISVRVIHSILRRQVRRGFAVLVGLNIFDLVSTFIALRAGAHEANPLAAALISLSPLTLIAMKVVVLGVTWWLTQRAPLGKALRSVWLLVGVYSMVALNNAVVLGRLVRG